MPWYATGVPSSRTPVKGKARRIVSPGLVDLHFHGAFGIDLMCAEAPELDRLSARLWEHGVAGFVATTLSVPAAELRATCARLGAWIESGTAPGALPLGIHLEGPFISPEACGAHPPGSIRPLTLPELEDLWEVSQGTLKILTVAPETLSPSLLKELTRWCRKRKIVLSLGHSRATDLQARAAFEAGFTGVTHAWNALNFHHRAPGVLGGAIGRKDTYLELILDGAHVHPTVIRWTLALHPRCCFISDCVPAAATSGQDWVSFGESLTTRFDGHVCRLPNGALAGGGLLLPESYGRWVQAEAKARAVAPEKLLRQTLACLTTTPLEALGIRSSRLRNHRVSWTISPLGQVSCRPNPGLTSPSRAG